MQNKVLLLNYKVKAWAKLVTNFKKILTIFYILIKDLVFSLILFVVCINL